ncbi:MAG: alpha/beta hydrolase [Rhodospirillales bacterium]|nr:alpha/beta hydrolase [Rhodospirillales bacterium]MCB9973689.1 alpha/beta hydrolase [Rhodospirillales bacterium]
MQHIPLHVYMALQASRTPEKLLRSFQKYLNAPYEHTPVPSEHISIIYQTSLTYFPAANCMQHTLFLVPSLINGAEIFDLTENFSFIRFLTAHGVSVYLLEWGDLSHVEAFDLADLLKERLAPLWTHAINHAQQIPHMMGYCLGGTLCADLFLQEYTIVLPQSLTFLAAPLDFQARDIFWEGVVRDPQRVKDEIIAHGVLTRRMLQSYFINLQAADTEEKFLKFYEMLPGSEAEKIFIAVEHWLNGGGDLPRDLALDLIDRYFIENRVCAGLSRMPSRPFCQITSVNDRIVAPESARILQKHHPQITSIDTTCGHVGMMAGKNAPETVWKPFVDFIGRAATQQR